MDKKIQGLLQFIKESEKLKTELRHSWTSEQGRQESVADHSWMLSLMAMVLPEMVGIRMDRYKLLKMVVLHDLAEAIVGDIPSFEKSERQDNKYEAEKAAMAGIVSSLPGGIAQELIDIWEEMEARETAEAKMAHAIDKKCLFSTASPMWIPGTTGIILLASTIKTIISTSTHSSAHSEIV